MLGLIRTSLRTHCMLGLGAVLVPFLLAAVVGLFYLLPRLVGPMEEIVEEVVGELRRLGSSLAEKFEATVEDGEERPERRSTVFVGLALIVIGAAFFLKNFFPWLALESLWPVLLIGVGVLLLIGAARREKVS